MITAKMSFVVVLFSVLSAVAAQADETPTALTCVGPFNQDGQRLAIQIDQPPVIEEGTVQVKTQMLRELNGCGGHFVRLLAEPVIETGMIHAQCCAPTEIQMWRGKLTLLAGNKNAELDGADGRQSFNCFSGDLSQVSGFLTGADAQD